MPPPEPTGQDEASGAEPAAGGEETPSRDLDPTEEAGAAVPPSRPTRSVANARGASSTDEGNASEAEGEPLPELDPDAPRTNAGLPTGADKSGVTSKTISLPKGAGSVEGMGESFSSQLWRCRRLTRKRRLATSRTVWLLGLMSACVAKSDVTKGREAEQTLRDLHGAVGHYGIEQGVVPPSLAELARAGYVLPSVLRDPWGRSYEYRVGGAGYSLFSAGPDRTPETADDISVDCGLPNSTSRKCWRPN